MYDLECVLCHDHYLANVELVTSALRDRAVLSLILHTKDEHGLKKLIICLLGMATHHKNVSNKLGDNVVRILGNVAEGEMTDDHLKEFTRQLGETPDGCNSLLGKHNRRMERNRYRDMRAEMNEVLSDWYNNELHELTKKDAIHKLVAIFKSPTLCTYKRIVGDIDTVLLNADQTHSGRKRKKTGRNEAAEVPELPDVPEESPGQTPGDKLEVMMKLLEDQSKTKPTAVRETFK